MTFIIEISDQAVMAALTRLQHAVEHPQPIMRTIGDDIMKRIKERFAPASGPDGQPWATNTEVTLMRYIKSRRGFGKDRAPGGRGKGINDKGQTLAISKRPLQGITRNLARQFHVAATDNTVTISSSMIYAAMQQFGGTRAQFPNLWGDIPARPFFPVTAGGEFYPDERDLVLAQLQRYIQGSVEG